MIGMQKGRPSPRKKKKKGDYVVRFDFPNTIWKIKKFEGDFVFLKFAGGYRPTEDERVRFFSGGGSYIHRRVWAAAFHNLESPNEMLLLALIRTEDE